MRWQALQSVPSFCFATTAVWQAWQSSFAWLPTQFEVAVARVVEAQPASTPVAPWHFSQAAPKRVACASSAR